jgi:hypothetical protein
MDGKIIEVINTVHRWGEADTYFGVKVIVGKERHYAFFTATELDRAMDRTAKQPELMEMYHTTTGNGKTWWKFW